MLGWPARPCCVASITHKPRPSQGATQWPSIRLLRRDTADHRSDSPGRAIDRNQLRLSAHDGEDRVQLQSLRTGFDLVGERALSVHRSDVAWHHEAGRGRARAGPLRRRHYARAADGHYDVSDPAMRAAILRLRSDPQASAMLAGALTRNNAALVGSNIGRKPTNGELYIAHFLGADGAGKLINGAASRPQASAAAMFPHAAAANHNIFYDVRPRPQRRRSLRKAHDPF